jgi:hypothetical protein
VLVAAVVALGLAAAVDALERGDDGAPHLRPRRPAAETAGDGAAAWRRTAAAELAEHGVRGTLVWLDPRCRVHALRLPGLEPVAAPARRRCSPAGERRLVPAVRVRFAAQAETAVRRGELVRLGACGGPPPCSRLLLSRRDVLRALGRNPWGFTRPALAETAWLTASTFAAIVRDGAGGGSLLAVFRGLRLVGAPPFAYGSLVRLRASPYGTYAAAAVRGRGMVIVDRGGELRPDGLSGAHAIAWSPDETWTAMAREDAVYLFQTGTRAVSLIRLPLVAADLDWR